MKKLLSRYNPGFLLTIIYMLQLTEYKITDYLDWINRTKNFNNVSKRNKLKFTAKAKLLFLIEVFLFVVILIIGFLLCLVGFIDRDILILAAAFLVILLYPWALSYLILIPLIIGQFFIQVPKHKRIIRQAQAIFESHKALKIAIVGSYGKTTAKEIINTVLSEGKIVAVTPGNMNTPIGVSRFAQTLTGNEEVLIIEMGEAKIGDINELCKIARPNMGIITGINEAHLSTFGTIENTVNTIYELTNFVSETNIYKNSESQILNQRISKKDKLQYNRNGLSGWTVKNIKTNIEGTEFVVEKDGRTIKFKTGLLGFHNIGIILVAVDIAANLGFTEEQIIRGVCKTTPFEHRFKPRNICGAWIIDDTYNGNSEGVAAGLAFLKQLDAKRKIYVTPGLVEHGHKTIEIHEKIGKSIAEVADVVVLMKNSTTKHILSGLTKAGYVGEIKIIDEPLHFYQNIEHFVAAGDVVLMQNDWTDNYA